MIETPVILHIPGVPEIITMTWVAMALLICLAFIGSRHLATVPHPVQNVLEFFYESFSHLMGSIMGPQGVRFVPFLGTIFLFVLAGNFLGLVPGFKAPTASLNTTVALALVVFVASHFYGIRCRGLKGYLLHYTGDLWYLAPLMVFIHFIGELARPFSLAVRLFANVMGDDLSLAILLSILPLIAKMVLPLFLPPLLIIVDALIAFIQALVFAVLSAVYISQLAGFDEMEELAEE